jgi:DNA polymerase III delta prime subunit
MRRALNVLQACHAAYDRIGETEVYTCTGSPHPSDIEAIVNSMLTDEFTTSDQSKQFDLKPSHKLMTRASDHCAQD